MSVHSLSGDMKGTILSPSGEVAVVFGASGGIGRALVDRLRQEARFGQVIALGRTTSPAFDLTSEDSIESAARHVAERGEPLLVVDATGFLHDDSQSPEKSLRSVDAAAMTRAFLLNAIGPVLLMKHMLPRLPRHRPAVFATLSARVASIGDNRLGGWYSYRASKAALNQLVRTAAIELARTHPLAICVATHPGTVDTKLSAPFVGRNTKIQTPEQAATRLLDVLARLTPADTGGFFDHHGETVPW